MIDWIFSNYSYQSFLPLPRPIGLQKMVEEKEEVCAWGVWLGVFSPGFGGELDEPLMEPTGITGRTGRPKHSTLPISSPHSHSFCLSFLSDQASTHFYLQFKWKSDTYPANLDPSAFPRHNNREAEEKSSRKKSKWDKKTGREGYCVTARLDCQMP